MRFFCKRHPHSSPERAIKCAISSFQRWERKRMERMGYPKPNVRMVKHPKGRITVRQGIEFIIFQEDANMSY